MHAHAEYLAHTYAAEACCALIVLRTRSACECRHEPRSNVWGYGPCPARAKSPHAGNKYSIATQPNSSAARAALCVNAANVRLQQNELEQAERALNQALRCTHPF